MTTTGAYSTAAGDLLPVAPRHVLRAVAYGGNLSGSLPLDLAGASIVWDEARAPRVTASLTLAVDTIEELATLAQLDPRAGVRVALEAGYVLDTGAEDVTDLADLGLRTVSVTRPDASVRLELASDEALVIDASPAVNAPVSAASHTAAMITLVNQAVTPRPVFTVAATSGGSVTVDPVTDRWSTIADLADRIGARVYDEGLRRWKIAPAPTVASDPDVILTGGAGGTLTGTEDTIDREAWANYITHVYEWRDAAGVDKRVQATALVTTGPYRVAGPAGKRIRIDQRNVPTTQAAANAAAASVLSRQLTRSRTQTVTAVAAWWLRPGMTARVVTVAGTADRIVSRVAFSWPSRMMDVTSRLPDTALADGAAPTVTTTTPAPAIPTDPTVTTTDPTPEAATKQTYVSSWAASGFATYTGTGTQRVDAAVAHDTAHGDAGDGYGNQSAVILFTGANSTGDEVGKTITQALTGATVGRVRFRGYASSWFSPSGGTARLGYYAGTTLPATFTAAAPTVTVKDWPRNSYRTADLTSNAFTAALLAGTSRGITVGPGTTSVPELSGKLAADGVNVPTLEITYAK